MSLTEAPPAPAPAVTTTSRVLLVAAGAAFLALLDTTVANLAVADVRSDFAGASVGAATWLITIYAVVFAALLAPAGRVADVVGRRALLLAGVAAFTAFSLACALAPSLEFLLVSRALQGAAAAMMIPASLAVVLMDAPPERRAAAIGLWSAAGALAAAAGPAIGGVLVDTVGWRALFLINVPVGLAIIAGTRLIPRSAPRRQRLPDAVGTLLLGAGIAAAALGISQGPVWGWGDERTVGALVFAAVAVALALWRSARHAVPAIEIELWRSHRFAAANLASLLYGAALFPWMLVGVLFLIGIWGYSPLEAGLAMTPGALIAAVVALRAGPVVARRGPWAVIAGGALVLAARRPDLRRGDHRDPALPRAVAAARGADRHRHRRDHHRRLDRRGAVGAARALRRRRRPQPDRPPDRRRTRHRGPGRAAHRRRPRRRPVRPRLRVLHPRHVRRRADGAVAHPEGGTMKHRHHRGGDPRGPGLARTAAGGVVSARAAS